MIYKDDRPSSLTFPMIALLLVMAAMVGTLFVAGGDQERVTGRVWISQPADQGGRT